MRKGLTTLAVLCILPVGLTMTGCDTYSYPTPLPTKEEMSDNSYVYGDPEGPPRQTKNTYPANPDAVTRAGEIKAKLFSEVPGVMSKWDTKNAATSAAPAAGHDMSGQPAQGPDMQSASGAHN